MSYMFCTRIEDAAFSCTFHDFPTSWGTFELKDVVDETGGRCDLFRWLCSEFQVVEEDHPDDRPRCK